jgi:hypothetical protein
MQAIFSECGTFRHLLWDVWDANKPMLTWCLFNPSVAGQDAGNAMKTDPTWRKGRGFSERLGYGGQVFCNLFDFISTDPAGLKAAGNPVSKENDRYILQACSMGDGTVLCAWGSLGRKLSRPNHGLTMICAAGFRPMALGFTHDGLPRHPLMLGYATALDPMKGPRSPA